MSKLLQGKTALVTGASSGLGRHFAQVLAEEGAMVIACARRIAPLEELVSDLKARNLSCKAVALDVTKPESVAAAFAEVREATGSAPDIVVNNAGGAQTRPAIDMSESDWTDIIDLNLNGVFRVAQAAARELVRDGKPGSIVNIASILGLRVASNVASYAASKAAVRHLTKALALEWARYGIRVNAIAPGYVETDLNRAFFESDAGKKLIQRIPSRSLGSLEGLDGPLKLLCSDASAEMTGSILVVDKGHAVSSL